MLLKKILLSPSYVEEFSMVLFIIKLHRRNGMKLEYSSEEAPAPSSPVQSIYLLSLSPDSVQLISFPMANSNLPRRIIKVLNSLGPSVDDPLSVSCIRTRSGCDLPALRGREAWEGDWNFSFRFYVQEVDLTSIAWIAVIAYKVEIQTAQNLQGAGVVRVLVVLSFGLPKIA